MNVDLAQGVAADVHEPVRLARFHDEDITCGCLVFLIADSTFRTVAMM
jgi:hypothetical protein